MNGPGNVKINFTIKFNGKVYKSVDEMPPEERALYEMARAKLAQQNSGEDLSQKVADALKQAEALSGGQDYNQLIAGALKQAEALAGGQERPATLPKAWESSAGTPTVPQGFETVTNLGEAVNSYLARKYSNTANLVIGGVLFALGAVFDLFGLAKFLSAGRSSAAGDIVGLAIPGTILLLLGLFLLSDPIRMLLNLQEVFKALVIYRDGFAYRTSNQIHVFPWRSIASIFSDETFHSTRSGLGYTDEHFLLVLKNGEKVSLTDSQFLEIGLIIRQIKQAVYAELRPTLQSAYENGSSLAFGPVKVSQNAGIEADGRQFAWNTVYNVSVKQGRLKIVTKDEKTFNVRAKLIPNIEMLCQLIGVEPYEIDLSYI